MAAKVEGLPIGISSGAALAAGIEVAQRKEMKNKKIILLFLPLQNVIYQLHYLINRCAKKNK